MVRDVMRPAHDADGDDHDRPNTPRRIPTRSRASSLARREGLAYALEHPDEAADITAKAYNKPNTDLFRRSVRELLKDQLLERWALRL